jgi:prepilin-type N-terminal cleavage/methylation domain-containing protein
MSLAYPQRFGSHRLFLQHRSSRGLTLVEVLVSIAMIGLLASALAMIAPRFLQVNKQSSGEQLATSTVQELSEKIKAEWDNSACYDANGKNSAGKVAVCDVDIDTLLGAARINGFKSFDEPSGSTLEWKNLDITDGDYQTLAQGRIDQLDDGEEEVDSTDPDNPVGTDPIVATTDDTEPDVDDDPDDPKDKAEEDDDGYEDDVADDPVKIINIKRIKITLVPTTACKTTSECAPKILVFDIGRPTA